MIGTAFKQGSVMMTIAPVDRGPDAWPCLSTAEIRKIGRLHRADDKAAYAMAHGLLRHLICRATGQSPGDVELVYDSRGKPGLQSPLADMRISLSHARTGVAVALSLGVDIGIDLECPTGIAPDEEILALALTERERATLEAGQSPAAIERWFLRLWTAKEALLKANGLGITAGLQTICFAGGLDRADISPSVKIAGPWKINSYETETTISSLALGAGVKTVLAFDWTELRLRT